MRLPGFEWPRTVGVTAFATSNFISQTALRNVRVFAALWLSGLLIFGFVTSIPIVKFTYFLTNWSLLMLATYYCLSALISIFVCSRLPRTDFANAVGVLLVEPDYRERDRERYLRVAHIQNGESAPLIFDRASMSDATRASLELAVPAWMRSVHFLRLVFIVFEIATSVAPLVTTVYWTVLYPALKAAYPTTALIYDCQAHTLNLFFSLVAIFTGRLIHHFWHVAFLCAYALVYMCAAFLVHATVGEWPYAFLNTAVPGAWALYLGLFAMVVLSYLIVFLISIFRDWLADRYWRAS